MRVSKLRSSAASSDGGGADAPKAMLVQRRTTAASEIIVRIGRILFQLAWSLSASDVGACIFAQRQTRCTIPQARGFAIIFPRQHLHTRIARESQKGLALRGGRPQDLANR